jgi:aminoglycoside phosphotransferase (APT) family kinase protein
MKDVISHRQLCELLQQVMGRQVVIAAKEVLKREKDYLVLIVSLEQPSIKVVVKVAGAEAPLASSFDRTAMLHRLVADQTAISMPEVMGVDVSGKAWPFRYLVRRYSSGREWAYVLGEMSPDELCSVYHQLGEAVAQLHSVRFPAFGELANDGSVQDPAPFEAAFRERARQSIKNPRLLALFMQVLENRWDLFTGVSQPCLCHEDLHGYNILFERGEKGWQLTAILDFDKTWAGHAEIDLARMEIWRGMTSAEFWSSYRAVHALDLYYELRRPIYQLLWCFEYARNTPRHLEDTRLLCEKLGIPSPEYFD